MPEPVPASNAAPVPGLSDFDFSELRHYVDNLGVLVDPDDRMREAVIILRIVRQLPTPDIGVGLGAGLANAAHRYALLGGDFALVLEEFHALTELLAGYVGARLITAELKPLIAAELSEMKLKVDKEHGDNGGRPPVAVFGADWILMCKDIWAKNGQLSEGQVFVKVAEQWATKYAEKPFARSTIKRAIERELKEIGLNPPYEQSLKNTILSTEARGVPRRESGQHGGLENPEVPR